MDEQGKIGKQPKHECWEKAGDKLISVHSVKFDCKIEITGTLENLYQLKLFNN